MPNYDIIGEFIWGLHISGSPRVAMIRNQATSETTSVVRNKPQTQSHIYIIICMYIYIYIYVEIGA